MKELTKIEEILLISIWKLKENAYGVKIRQYINQYLGRDLSYGNLYSILDQLVKKGYVSKTVGDSSPKRRGRSRIYYSLQPEGSQALKSAQEHKDTLWDGISKYAFDN
ncbi:PadR family transcriptional regulator [candidate division KSB1 bacterium]